MVLVELYYKGQLLETISLSETFRKEDRVVLDEGTYVLVKPRPHGWDVELVEEYYDDRES